jgi:hypothetical protein
VFHCGLPGKVRYFTGSLPPPLRVFALQAAHE